MEQSKERQTLLVIDCVAFQKAFDSIDRDSIWEILRIYRLPSNIINVIFTSLVWNCLGFLMRRTEEMKSRINWTDEKVLGDLDFADDICLINSYIEEVQTKTNSLSGNAKQSRALQCLQK